MVLDLPPGTAFGLDTSTFLTGPQFRGVKMIPPGCHWISTHASSRAANTNPPSIPGGGHFAPVVSTAVHLQPKQVVVFQWIREEEALRVIHNPQIALAARTPDWDIALAPYDFGRWATWTSLSGHVSARTVDRLLPVGGQICILSEEDPADYRAPTEREKVLAAALANGRREGDDHDSIYTDARATTTTRLPDGSAAQTTSSCTTPHGPRCKYTNLPRLRRQALAHAATTSPYALYLDQSPVLRRLLAELDPDTHFEALGEMQFAFVAFLMGQSMDGFQQWRAWGGVVLQCDDAMLGDLGDWVAEALLVLSRQLSAIGSGGTASAARYHRRGVDETGVEGMGPTLLDDVLGEGLAGARSFLRPRMAGLFESLVESAADVSPPLAKAAKELKGVVRQVLGWDMDVELLGGEDGPVVVWGDMG